MPQAKILRFVPMTAQTILIAGLSHMSNQVLGGLILRPNAGWKMVFQMQFQEIVVCRVWRFKVVGGGELTFFFSYI